MKANSSAYGHIFAVMATSALYIALLWGKPVYAQRSLEQIRVGTLEVFYFTVRRGTADVRLLSPRFPDAYTSPSRVPRERTNGAFLLEMADQFAPQVAISGGYLSSFEPPVGLGFLKVAGRELQPVHRTWLTNGVFCSSGKEWMISEFRSESVISGFPDCLQAGPLLVRDGETTYADPSRLSVQEKELATARQDQAFLCTTRAGGLVLGFARGGTAAELAKVSSQNMGCIWTLRLSGSVTAGLWTRSAGLLGHSEIRLTNGVAVFD
jgi:hypothetical protein